MEYTPEEDREWEQESVQVEREWLVEYVLDIPEEGEAVRMITILRGAQMSDVQSRLYDILRSQYASHQRLDVTVIRMEPVDMRTDVAMFEIGGTYQP
ncbi:MAG: hypothetical protein QF440_02970 [Candidatus Thalassarchaeaceae archaeon]|jgi:hypothetical protein|nr:hypothetical protein [Candidatus Thalassarchaeaceae archaeon]